MIEFFEIFWKGGIVSVFTIILLFLVPYYTYKAWKKQPDVFMQRTPIMAMLLMIWSMMIGLSREAIVGTKFVLFHEMLVISTIPMILVIFGIVYSDLAVIEKNKVSS